MTNIKRWEEDNHWVEIDLDRCMGSGDCVNGCPADVYKVINGKVNAQNIGECIECGTCQYRCPFKAILKHAAWR